jgi:hypothetical protein
MAKYGISFDGSGVGIAGVSSGVSSSGRHPTWMAREENKERTCRSLNKSMMPPLSYLITPSCDRYRLIKLSGRWGLCDGLTNYRIIRPVENIRDIAEAT